MRHRGTTPDFVTCKDKTRAGQSRKITRVGRNENVKRGLCEIVERHSDVKRNEKSTEMTKERKERSQCGGEDRGHTQHQH